MSEIRRTGWLHHLRYFLDPPNQGLVKGKGAWRVYYPPNDIDSKGGYSIRMSYGSACDYAEMFGGQVVKADAPRKQGGAA